MSEQQKNIEITRQKRTFSSHDGTPLLICAADCVHIEGKKKFNEFYEKVCENCFEYCERELLRNCQPPSLYSYKLTCKAREEDGSLAVILTATFTDRTTRKVIFSATYTHIWDKDGYLRRKKRKIKKLTK